MDDTLTCPICQNKLRNIKTYRLLHYIGKSSWYIERTCSKGPNHRGMQFFTDEETGKVDLLKLPLNAQYSQYLEIDFYNQNCRISSTKDGRTEYLVLDKMITPDFPALDKLKERVSLYVLFS
jgi:hypothetical protein